MPSADLRSESIMSSENSPDLESQISMSQEVSEDAKTARRIRLTNILLKHQSQLKELESAGVQSNEKIEEVNQLRIKIENLESMIKKLSQ